MRVRSAPCSRRLLAIAIRASVVLSAACAASAPPAPRAAPADDARGAIDAWARGDVEEALALAERHLRAAPDSDVAREIAARAALAGGDPARAVARTASRRAEPLVRLRAAAHLARDEYGEAADALASLAHAEEDPWAQAIARIAEAARGRSLHQRAGAEREELALRVDCALPVIAIRVEGRDALALIATSVHLTVLAPALRADHGVADEIELGRARVRDVPFVVRDLALESAALGVPIAAVLGTDVLGRLGTTIDGPAGRVIVGAEPAGARVGTARFDGSVLAVRARIGAGRGWLLLDTAGAFAIALSPRGSERLGAVDGATATVGLGVALEMTDVPIQLGVVGDELEEQTTAPIDGALGWAVLAQTRVSVAPDGVSVVAPHPGSS